MLGIRILAITAIAALLTGAVAHAEPAKPQPKLGSVPSDGRGQSIASEQQQIEADKFQMRQDKLNKDSRKYEKHQRQMQRDQEQLNRQQQNR